MQKTINRENSLLTDFQLDSAQQWTAKRRIKATQVQLCVQLNLQAERFRVCSSADILAADPRAGTKGPFGKQTLKKVHPLAVLRLRALVLSTTTAMTGIFHQFLKNGKQFFTPFFLRFSASKLSLLPVAASTAILVVPIIPRMSQLCFEVNRSHTKALPKRERLNDNYRAGGICLEEFCNVS